jgi:hypothetical protein
VSDPQVPSGPLPLSLAETLLSLAETLHWESDEVNFPPFACFWTETYQRDAILVLPLDCTPLTLARL